MYIKYYLIGLILLSYTAQACAVNKKNNTPTTATDSSRVDTPVKAIDTPDVIESSGLEMAQWVDPYYYKTMKYKAKCSFESEKMSQGFTAKISIKKDSTIFISVIGLGIMEVARAMVTPDSLYLLDRINSVAYIKDYSYLAEITGADMDFQTFQSILTNELPQQLPATVIEEDSLVLLQYKPAPELDAKIAIDSQARRWTGMQLYFDQPDIDSVELTMDKYQDIEGVPVSFWRKVSVYLTEGFQELEMELEDVQINADLNIRFTIPSRFEIRN